MSGQRELLHHLEKQVSVRQREGYPACRTLTSKSCDPCKHGKVAVRIVVIIDNLDQFHFVPHKSISWMLSKLELAENISAQRYSSAA